MADVVAAVCLGGCRVRVDGLKSAVAFNGKEGTVISFDRELGRYDVQLAEAAGEEVEMLKVKRTNLVVVSGIEGERPLLRFGVTDLRESLRPPPLP